MINIDWFLEPFVVIHFSDCILASSYLVNNLAFDFNVEILFSLVKYFFVFKFLPVKICIINIIKSNQLNLAVLIHIFF